MDILKKEMRLNQLEATLKELDDAQAKEEIKEKIEAYKNNMMKKLTAWDRVLLARHPKRLTAKDVIDCVFDEFMDLHGDRAFEDDQAIIGGIATIAGRAVTVIGQQKGKTTEENIKCNFAMPHPEGYRKALRLMKQAEKFNRPIITLIDTPGAYPGIGAESRGQGEAIAKNLYEMSGLKVPVIAIVLGEGGSGGALAIGVGNHVYMLENSIYSILSPEGYASILWKDAAKAKDAAEVMKLTSYDLREQGVITGIIKEPIGGAHRHPKNTCLNIKDTIMRSLKHFDTYSAFEITKERYNTYRSIGFLQRFNYENLKGVIK